MIFPIAQALTTRYCAQKKVPDQNTKERILKKLEASVMEEIKKIYTPSDATYWLQKLPLVLWSTRALMKIACPILYARNTKELSAQMLTLEQNTIPQLCSHAQKRGPLFSGLQPISTSMITTLCQERLLLPQSKKTLPRKESQYTILKNRVCSVIERYLQKNLYRWAAIGHNQASPICALRIAMDQMAHCEAAKNRKELLAKLQHMRSVSIPKLCALENAPIASLEHTKIAIDSQMELILKG